MLNFLLKLKPDKNLVLSLENIVKKIDTNSKITSYLPPILERKNHFGIVFKQVIIDKYNNAWIPKAKNKIYFGGEDYSAREFFKEWEMSPIPSGILDLNYQEFCYRFAEHFQSNKRRMPDNSVIEMNAINLNLNSESWGNEKIEYNIESRHLILGVEIQKGWTGVIEVYPKEII